MSVSAWFVCVMCVHVSVSPHSLQSVLYAVICGHTNGSSEPVVQPLSEGSLYFSTGMSEDYTVSLLFYWPTPHPLYTYIKAAQRSAHHWARGTLAFSLCRPLVHAPHLPAGIAVGNHGPCLCMCMRVCVCLLGEKNVSSSLGLCISKKVLATSYVIHLW